MEQSKLKEIIEFFTENNKTISIAESITSGEITFQFLQQNLKMKKIFKGSVIMQNIQAHQAILKLSPNLISKYGIVSREVSIETALAIRKLLMTNLGIGITGDLSNKNENANIYFTIAYEDSIINFSLKIETNNPIEKNLIITNQIVEELHKIIFNR